MLVLARRSGDSIVIGDNIEITVVEVQGDNVKIGIKAPKKISIMRKELLEAVSVANKQAASPDVNLTLLEDFIKTKKTEQ
jgi:carbon storage regulator